MFNYYVKNDLFFEKLKRELEELFTKLNVESFTFDDAQEIKSLLSQITPEQQQLVQALIERLM